VITDEIGGVVLGDRKSVKEMAYIYQKVYGIEPEIKRNGSLKELYERMTAVFKEEAHNPFAWMGMYYQYYMQNGQTLLGKTDNDRYPKVVPTTVEAFLKEHTKEDVGSSGKFWT
jgi:hypothetical protein